MNWEWREPCANMVLSGLMLDRRGSSYRHGALAYESRCPHVLLAKTHVAHGFDAAKNYIVATHQIL